MRIMHLVKGQALACLTVALLACERYESLSMHPPGSLRTHYFVDFESHRDPETLLTTGGWLVVFNPASRPAQLDCTVYYEDRDPERFQLQARPGTSTAWYASDWPIRVSGRFALKAEASEPIIAQATLGWNNSGGDSSPTAITRSPKGIREAATSYMSILAPAERWFLADGTVLLDPTATWYRESEWTIVLNPNDEPAEVELAVFYSPLTRHHSATVPPRRLKAIRMDDLVLANHHYGLRVASDRPVVVQSRRDVYWPDSPELMTFWSVPLAPFSIAADTGVPAAP
jgi:hypothetical protein